MKVLVTGVAGFIGSATARNLIAAGHTVVGVDNYSTGKSENIRQLPIDMQVADIRLSKMKSYMRGCDAVIHLAAIASVPACEKNWHEAFSVNVEGTVNLLECAKSAGVPRFVFASSAAVYGMAEGRLRETEPVQPISKYGASKAASEVYVNQSSLNTVILRYFNVYGERQDPSSPYSGVISKFISQARAKQTVVIYGNGHQSRDFVYVGDVARMNRLALGVPIGTYNVGTGESTSINDLASLLAKHVRYEDARPGDISLSLANTTHAEMLGFKAEMPLKDGLKRLVATEKL